MRCPRFRTKQYSIILFNSFSAVPVSMFAFYFIGVYFSMKVSFIAYAIFNVLLFAYLLITYAYIPKKEINATKLALRLKFAQTVAYVVSYFGVLTKSIAFPIGITLGASLITMFELLFVYLLFALNGQKDRGKLSIVAEVLYELSMVVVGVFSLFNQNPKILMSVPIVSNVVVMCFLKHTRDVFVTEKRENLTSDYSLIISMFLLITSLNIVYFITPFVFGEVGEKYIGPLYVVESLIGVVATPVITNTLLKHRDGLWLPASIGIIATLLLWATFKNGTITRIFVIIAVSVVAYSIILVLRHKLIKLTEESFSSLTLYQIFWGLSGIVMLPVGVVIPISVGTLLKTASSLSFLSFIVLTTGIIKEK